MTKFNYLWAILLFYTISCSSDTFVTQSGFLMETPVASLQPESTKSSVPIETNMPTSHPDEVETVRPLAPPTIDPAFKKEYIMQLLKGETHSCQLPCLWDIYPGKSNWTNLQEIFDPLGYSLTPSNYGSKKGITLGFELNDIQVSNLIINFVGEEGEIEYLRLQAASYSPEIGYFDEEFTEVLQRYSIQMVLSEFGSPSAVSIDNLAGGGGPGPSIFYVLHLYYYDIGVYFEYIFEDGLHQGSETITLCPDHEYMTDLMLIASTPDNPSVLFGIAGNYRNLEDMSYLSIEEFTELFATSTESVCFETFYDR